MATMDNNWRNWFADTIYRRGVQYYKNGHVREMHKITGGYEAIVAGHYLYRVEIITENDRVKDTHCNCQYAYSGEKCKHQVAALLEYKDMLSRQIVLEAQNQATDRSHRIGQKKTVTVFKLIAKGTNEEKIVELQNSKSDLAEEILSGETNIISKMTESDFMELLG
jgi:uncharacterized Zn finger protein